MLTPNEIRDIKFDKAVFGGYDINDVDKFFSVLSEDYATLFKENTMLKKKLKLLADTVEDYRSVDESMRKALITAQNMANEMVAEAEEKSRNMLDTASREAKAQISELTALVEQEEKKLTEARATTAEFIDSITAMFAAESEKFLSLKNVVAPAVAVEPKEEPAEKMADTLDEIAKSLDEKVKLEEEELARKAKESAVTNDPEEDEDADMKKAEDTVSFEKNIPTEEEMTALEVAAEKPHRRHRVEYENLKFGTSYDIKSEE